MKKTTKTLLVAGALTVTTNATGLDTSEPFICAVTQVNECLDGRGCETVLPEEVNAPTFIWVDVKKKQIRTNHNTVGARAANLTMLDGRHVLQGASDGTGQSIDGAAWTMSIENETGRFVGTVAVQQASVSLFGVCTELELD